MGKILAFSGSTSSVSINQELITAVSKHVKMHTVEVLSLIDFPAPLFSADLMKEQGIPPAMAQLKAKMDNADGFLVSTPEHNGSMPAVLKNTIDWLSMYDAKLFQSKPTVFLSTSPGPRGASSALEHLVAIMPYRGAEIVGHFSLPSFHENFANGAVKPERMAEIAIHLEALEAAVSDRVRV